LTPKLTPRRAAPADGPRPPRELAEAFAALAEAWPRLSRRERAAFLAHVRTLAGDGDGRE
jgi:hypothetical protein